MDRFATRLKKILDMRNIKQVEFCEITDIPKSAMSQYLSGTFEPKQDRLHIMADTLKVNPAWLMGYDVPMTDTPKPADFDVFSLPGVLPVPKTKKVPRLGTIACGTPILALENIETYDYIDENMHCDFTLECKGDSMEPRMQDGDIVLIRIQPEVENGQIAAVLIEDTATLKHVHYNKDKGILQLLSDNPTYPPQVYTGEELNSITVIGKAIGFVRYI